MWGEGGGPRYRILFPPLPCMAQASGGLGEAGSGSGDPSSDQDLDEYLQEWIMLNEAFQVRPASPGWARWVGGRVGGWCVCGGGGGRAGVGGGGVGRGRG